MAVLGLVVRAAHALLRVHFRPLNASQAKEIPSLISADGPAALLRFEKPVHTPRALMRGSKREIQSQELVVESLSSASASSHKLLAWSC